MVCLQHDRNELIVIHPCGARFALCPGYSERPYQKLCLCYVDHSNWLLAGISSQGKSRGCGTGCNFGSGKGHFSGHCGRLAVHRAVLRGLAMIPTERVVIVEGLVVKYDDRTI